MKGIFIFRGDDGIRETEVNLATPDLREAEDLAYHVSRCSLRFKHVSKCLATQSDDLNLVKNLLFGMIGFLVMTNKQAQDIFSYLWHGIH